MPTVGVDSIDLMWLWIKEHRPTLSDEPNEIYDYLKNSGFKLIYRFPFCSLTNPFHPKNWMLYIGLIGVALAIILITLNFGIPFMYSLLAGLCCEILFIIFIINDIFKIRIDLTSSIFFLIVNVILFVMDFFILYTSNPANTEFPTAALMWGISLLVVTIFLFSLLQILYYFIMGNIRDILMGREARRRQLQVVQVYERER
jgi:hypothetical protein